MLVGVLSCRAKSTGGSAHSLAVAAQVGGRGGGRRLSTPGRVEGGQSFHVSNSNVVVVNGELSSKALDDVVNAFEKLSSK